MLDITAANAVNVQRPAKAKPNAWRVRREAQAAAVAEIGPHAREGFEFESFKCDGRWAWKATDEVKPPTGAELKAMGGQKGFLTLTMAKNALGSSLASPTTARLVDSQSPQTRTTDVPAGVARHSSEDRPKTKAPNGVVVGETVMPAPKTRLAEDDGIPEFLRRKNSPEQRKKVAKLVEQSDPRQRNIKNPPDAKVAKAKAKKEGRGGGTKAALIGEMLLRKNGCTTAEILKMTGWPAVSVPQQAKMVGLKLRKEKDGRVTRYFGVPKK